MDPAYVKACLNLHAVLQNLEELVRHDSKAAALARDWHIAIQFTVRNGPSAHVIFNHGTCTVGRGAHAQPQVKLFFLSPAHLNRMMDGKGAPIPLKGFTRLPFLTKDFPKLTDRLEFYLKPTPERLADDAYLLMNTRLTMNTAAFAVRELAALDPVARLAAGRHPRRGRSLEGPARRPGGSLQIRPGICHTGKRGNRAPMACMFMRDLKVANAWFLNGKLDIFSAIARGYLHPGPDAHARCPGLVLDRIPIYLES